MIISYYEFVPPRPVWACLRAIIICDITFIVARHLEHCHPGKVPRRLDPAGESESESSRAHNVTIDHLRV